MSPGGKSPPTRCRQFAGTSSRAANEPLTAFLSDVFLFKIKQRHFVHPASVLCYVLREMASPSCSAAPPERAGVSARVLPLRLSVCAVFFRAAGEVAVGARLDGFLFCRFPGFRYSRFTFFGNRLTSGALCAMMFSGSVSGAVLFFPRGFESRVLHNCIVPFFTEVYSSGRRDQS